MGNTIEIIVPVRPGDHDRFRVEAHSDRIITNEVECPDGNLSKAYSKAYRESSADVVIFKHDDFWFRNWEAFELQLWATMAQYPIIGVAGTRSYAPNRNPAWWLQANARAGMVDGLNRGLVHHPAQGDFKTTINDYAPTFFGPPGPAAVLDGCMVAVARDEQLLFNTANLDPYRIANWFDPDFTFHFYDIAFTLNASVALSAMGQSACYVVLADVCHLSIGAGAGGKDWQIMARKFSMKHSMGKPLEFL